MELSKLQAEFTALQNDPSLYVEVNLQGREKALDYIDFIGEVARTRHSDAPLTALHQQARLLKTRLARINIDLFVRLRTKIQAGAYTREELRQQLNPFTTYSQGAPNQAHIGYDGLDVLISGLFEIEPPPQASQALTSDMVHYEPTPARVMLDLVDHVAFTPADVFYDLGSGLGQVALTIHLLTGVKAKGVEFEPLFCTYAQNCARQLGLSAVEFIHADAREADYSDGTLFYLFTPFKNLLLQAVLDRLKAAARTKVIKICTYGACTRHVARQSWLQSLDANADHEFKLAIFESKA